MLNRKLFTLVLLLTFVLSAGGVFAQLNITADTVSDNILLTREHSFYGLLHSNGWGFGFRKGLNKDYFKKQMFEVEFVEMRSPKETRTSNYGQRSFFYGKINACYILRSGVGYQHLLNQKPYWGGVEVRYFYYLGAEIAIAKPVYLKVASASGTGPDGPYYKTERSDPETQSIGSIFGRGSFFKGINQIKPYGGIYAKFGFNFEFGSYNTELKAVEAGIIIDYNPKAVPIMAYNKNSNIIPNVYISYHFGKRYN